MLLPLTHLFVNQADGGFRVLRKLRVAVQELVGEQQRVLIARALAQEPHVLLLDEATAHLDLKHQVATLRLVRQLARSGLLVIAAMHDLNLAAQYADRLALLSGELLAYDQPAAVLTPEWIQRAYGVAALVAPHPIAGTPVVALLEEEA